LLPAKVTATGQSFSGRRQICRLPTPAALKGLSKKFSIQFKLFKQYISTKIIKSEVQVVQLKASHSMEN
jgi:hypothetical protein